MSRSKIIQPLILLTKNLLFIFSLLMMLMTFKGCLLLEEGEYCKFETNESRIWDHEKHFTENFISEDADLATYYLVFNHSSKAEDANFNIENVCPLGALAVNIKITQKKDTIGLLSHWYNGSIYQSTTLNNGKVIYDHVKSFAFRISGNEFISYDLKTKNNIVLLLDGIPEEGPKKFYIVIYARVFGTSTYQGNLEDWAKDNILKVEYNATFVKYN